MEILEQPDCDFIEAANGMQACGEYQLHSPDWVIMDIEMPIMDGITATKTILKLRPNAKIIVVTQHGSTALEDAALKAGAHAFLSKENLLDLPSLLHPVRA